MAATAQQLLASFHCDAARRARRLLDSGTAPGHNSTHGGAQDAWWSVASGVHWGPPPSLQPFRLCVQYASEDGACGLLLFAFD